MFEPLDVFPKELWNLILEFEKSMRYGTIINKMETEFPLYAKGNVSRMRMKIHDKHKVVQYRDFIIRKGDEISQEYVKTDLGVKDFLRPGNNLSTFSVTYDNLVKIRISKCDEFQTITIDKKNTKDLSKHYEYNVCKLVHDLPYFFT